MPKTIHTRSSLQFTIKKGDVVFKQTESYKIGGDGSKSTDVFPGTCDLNSDKLHEWISAVCKSWIDGDSIRPDAVVEPDDEAEE